MYQFWIQADSVLIRICKYKPATLTVVFQKLREAVERSCGDEIIATVDIVREKLAYIRRRRAIGISLCNGIQQINCSGMYSQEVG